MPTLLNLDHNATTPCDPVVTAAIAEAMAAGYGNPASQHAAGRAARRRLEAARREVLCLLSAKIDGMTADRLVFVSGGTEANNLALASFAAARPNEPLFVGAMEHPSVVAMGESLARQGRTIRRVPARADGTYDVDWLETHLPAGAAGLAVLFAHNETGVLQPLDAMVAIARRRDVPVHCDAVQAVGKLPVDFQTLGVDTLTLAAHKFNGPLGIGALVVRHGVRLAPALHGGFQQAGDRPGTESVPLAVGLQTALSRWVEHRAAWVTTMRELRDSFEQAILSEAPETTVIGSTAIRLPQTSCLAFPGVDRQALFMALDADGIACSTGSACASGSNEPSPTLLAMGLSKGLVDGALRFGFGHEQTLSQAEAASERILKQIKRLRHGKNTGKTPDKAPEPT